MEKRIEFLDFAKGFAIVTIVLYHCLRTGSDSLFQKLILFGGAGVHLFIFLSAFGLTLATKKTFVRFYKRRFLKILIPYYFFIILLFILNFILPVYEHHNIYAFLGHIFLYKMFDNNIITSFGYHFWFLSTLFQFYILFPFLRRIMEKIKPGLFLLLSFFISIVYWIILYIFNLGENDVLRFLFVQFLWEFSLGMYLAEKYKKTGYTFWELNTVILLLSAVFGVGMVVILALKLKMIGRIFNDIPSFVGYTSLVILVYRFADRFVKLVKKWVLAIYNFAYSLYIIHGYLIALFIYFIITLFKINPDAPYYRIVFFPVILIIAFIYDYFTQKIFNRLARKI